MAWVRGYRLTGLAVDGSIKYKLQGTTDRGALNRERRMARNWIGENRIFRGRAG